MGQFLAKNDISLLTVLSFYAIIALYQNELICIYYSSSYIVEQYSIQMFVATQYATKKKVEFKCLLKLYLLGRASTVLGDVIVKIGNFYFLDDQYFIDFPDPQLARNKETINEKVHNRPCFFSFTNDSTKIYWMIPFSSNTSKYKKIYDKKISKRVNCDTLFFGDVLGYEKAFLIQNMCPVIDEYIKTPILLLLESMELWNND